MLLRYRLESVIYSGFPPAYGPYSIPAPGSLQHSWPPSALSWRHSHLSAAPRIFIPLDLAADGFPMAGSPIVSLRLSSLCARPLISSCSARLPLSCWDLRRDGNALRFSQVLFFGVTLFVAAFVLSWKWWDPDTLNFPRESFLVLRRA